MQEPGPLDGDVGYVIVDGNKPAYAVCNCLAEAPNRTMQVLSACISQQLHLAEISFSAGDAKLC